MCSGFFRSYKKIDKIGDADVRHLRLRVHFFFRCDNGVDAASIMQGLQRCTGTVDFFEQAHANGIGVLAVDAQ